MSRLLSLSLLVIAVVLSSACSSKKPRPEPVVYFSTNITAEGGKFFVYRLEMPQRSEQEGGRRGSRPMKGGRPDGGRDGGPPPTKDRKGGGREGDLEQRVDSLLAENLYCRDGYVILDKYAGGGGVSLRGECKDAATPADRNRFRNPV
ncbi:MAG: hypothetical protein V7459_05790 [Oceanicoccus sp.]